MSKGSGMGRKRVANKLNKGMDKCDAFSHGKQCGRIKEVSKGTKNWQSQDNLVKPTLKEGKIKKLDET